MAEEETPASVAREMAQDIDGWIQRMHIKRDALIEFAEKYEDKHR